MKFLIIGAGMIGRVHAEALVKMNLPFDVCDPKQEFAESLAKDYGAENVFSDYKKAIEETDAAAAVICTPNHLHCEPSVYAMEHGLDVLCEKPIASTVEQAKQMYEVQQKTGRLLMVGYIVRCYKALDRVREILDSGVLGKIVSARCILATPETLDVAKTTYRLKYETGGGIIYDYTHEIDYCRYLLGEAEYGAALCDCYLNQSRSVDDSADILIHFVSGVNLELHMDYIQWVGHGGHARSFEIICEKGTLQCDFKTVDTFRNDGKADHEDCNLDWYAAFITQYERFIAAVEGKPGIPYVTAESGMKTLMIADRLYESVRERKFVNF